MSRAKILVIESCVDCPHYDYDHRVDGPKECRELGRALRSNSLAIPKDCPLESPGEWLANKQANVKAKR